MMTERCKFCGEPQHGPGNLIRHDRETYAQHHLLWTDYGTMRAFDPEELRIEAMSEAEYRAELDRDEAESEARLAERLKP